MDIETLRATVASQSRQVDEMRKERDEVVTIEVEREADGRWIADVVKLPGCMAYGSTRGEAVVNALRLVSRVV